MLSKGKLNPLREQTEYKVLLIIQREVDPPPREHHRPQHGLLSSELLLQVFHLRPYSYLSQVTVAPLMAWPSVLSWLILIPLSIRVPS